MRSPPKKATNAAEVARGVDVLMRKDQREAKWDNLEKENRKPIEDAESMEVE